MNEEQKKELHERAVNIRKYKVLKPLSGWFSKYKNKGVGEVFNSEVLYDRGYNIQQLIHQGSIELIPDVFPFQADIAGKNRHSVYSRCPECFQMSINMPLEVGCPSCGYPKTITYYDAETISDYINTLLG